MTSEEIETTIADFVDAAVRSQEAGFDGVEIWAAYHCLLDQFWTPFSNQRQDKWGGSLENRTRLSREILKRIRESCGADFIIGLAVNDNAEVPVCLSRHAMVEIVARHDADGPMDYVTVGSGSYFDFYKLLPSFQYGENLGADLSELLMAAGLRAKITAESNIRTPENANALLGAGRADLVSIVRGQIADPHLVTKAQSGRPEDVRGCLSCNQQCWGRRGRDYYVSCLVNPSVGHEHLWGGDRFTTAADAKSVLVIGGGPAGCEAARVAAERGHRVTLAEATPNLGGQFRLAGLQPRRTQIIDLIAWYERQFQHLGVDVQYNTCFDVGDIDGLAPQEIILATGSLPPGSGFQKALPHAARMPGVEVGNVWSCEDIMGRAARPGQRIIVLDEGGHWRGIGTAWHLAEAGHKVTIVTPDAMIAKELVRSATDFPARQTLAKLGVRFVTETAISGWTGAQAETISLLTGETGSIAADGLVLATGNLADPTLYEALRARGIEAVRIGDASAPRLAAAAIYDGRVAGLGI